MTTAPSDRLVSVMITVYNGESYLAEAIESVLTQTYRPLPARRARRRINGWQRRCGEAFWLLRYERQENAGMGGARNSAIALGEYFAFLDADDRFRPEKIAQMDVMQADPSVDVVFGHMTEFVSPDVDEQAAALLREPADDLPWRTPNLMLIRRDSFERVGLFLGRAPGGDRRGLVRASYGTRAEGIRVAVRRRLHASNNGIRQRDVRDQYLHVLKASLDRRRLLADGGDP